MSNNQNFNNRLSDYVEVNVRIQKFWEKHPQGRIETHILKWTDDGLIVVEAFVYRDASDEKPTANGHAQEREGSSQVNKTSALENCETSAVGRALANAGFEIKKSVASREEVANATHQQVQPQSKLKNVQGLATPEQKNQVGVLLKKIGMTKPEFNEILLALDIANYSELTQDQWKRLVDNIATYDRKEAAQ